jgi:hypothetical protein
MSATQKIIAGQSFMIGCCVFYLLWWRLSYRPDVSVNRVSGINGLLFALTVLCGLAGVILSLSGSGALPAVHPRRLKTAQILIGGVIAYVILLGLTSSLFHRPVTTELFLITAWTMMEVSLLNALEGASVITSGRCTAGFCIIAAAAAVSLVLYVLYYRMAPMRAFYAAMVPLITEGISMGVVLALMLCP